MKRLFLLKIAALVLLAGCGPVQPPPPPASYPETESILNLRIVDGPADEAALAGIRKRGSDLMTFNDEALLVRKEIAVSGHMIACAELRYDARSVAKVLILFDQNGAELLREITEENVGQRLALVFDGEILTAAVINEIIPTGVIELSGGYSADEAERISALISQGRRC